MTRTSDPKAEIFYSTVVAPGVLLDTEPFSFGVSFPITTARIRLPDGTLTARDTKFQEKDYDVSFSVKVFRYF